MAMEKSGSGQLSEANGVEDMAVLKSSLKVESSPKTSCSKKHEPCWRHRSTWTKLEDEKLTEATIKYRESNWKAISKEVGTKDYTQCLQRWKRALKPNLRKGRWTIGEDALLVALISWGHLSWVEMAKRIVGRSSKQCRERWMFYLDPRIKKGGYTVIEDAAILRHQKILGNKWAQIASVIPRRTENDIKTRFIALNRKGPGGEDNTQTKHSPSTRSVTDNHIKLRQVAAQAMSCLGTWPDTGVSLPKLGEPLIRVVEGDTMDTRNVFPINGPLCLVQSSDGFTALIDGSDQVVWKEAGMKLGTGALYSLGGGLGQKDNRCGFCGKEHRIEQSKGILNRIKSPLTVLSPPMDTNSPRSSEVDYKSKLRNVEESCHKLPGVIATHGSTPKCASSAQAAATLYGKQIHCEVDRSPVSEVCGGKSAHHSFEGLNALGMAADLKTGGSRCGSKKHQREEGDNSNDVHIPVVNRGPNVLTPKGTPKDTPKDMPSCSSETKRIKQIGTNSIRSTLFSSLFGKSMSFIAKERLQPESIGMKPPFHLQRGGGCDYTNAKSLQKLCPPVRRTTYLPV